MVDLDCVRPCLKTEAKSLSSNESYHAILILIPQSPEFQGNFKQSKEFQVAKLLINTFIRIIKVDVLGSYSCNEFSKQEGIIKSRTAKLLPNPSL